MDLLAGRSDTDCSRHRPIIKTVRARDQGNAIPDKDFKKHLKREVDTAIKIKKRCLEHLSVHPAIKLASSLWEGETMTPLDELTMESITKACQKSKRKGVLSSTDLEEVIIEDGELNRWWLPPAAEEMEVDDPEPPAKHRPTRALPKWAVLQVNTEGAAQGAAEQEEGSSPTPQNTYITEEGTVNMIKRTTRSPCNYARLEYTIQPDAFETRNYECISCTRFAEADQKLTEVLKDGTAGRPDWPIPSPSVSLCPIPSAVPSPILFSGHNLAEGVAGPSHLPAGSSMVHSTGAPAKCVSSTSHGRK
ncbi:hypothetical protein BC834DRAFT_847188 [Gloeopeniophorella convolvens]|nr:hypothetical protein BC834DRAFT_847188 [Gloeopeniophorella convolvens]